MILVDKHYGCEFITGKGKLYKFDDVNCMVDFMAKEPAKSDTQGMALLIDFNAENQFITADKAVFLKHTGLRSPMGSSIAAFNNADAAAAVDRNLGGGGKVLQWSEVVSQSSGNCTCGH
jgi:copper chaperone NosL